MSESYNKITELLARVAAGNGEAIDADAEDNLYQLVHAELRKIAGARLKDESPGHSLRATELVDEAFLKIVGKCDFHNRSHFYRTAARAMRQIVIDRARKRQRAIEKRLAEGPTPPAEIAAPPMQEVLQLDEALRAFEKIDTRAAEVIQLRYFGGHTIKETAEILGCAERTVKNDWAAARAWLMRELSDES